MKQELVAKRYADALVQIAREKQSINIFEEELKVVKEVVSHNKEFSIFLRSPNIESAKKKAMVQNAFASLSKEIVNTILLLIDSRRENTVVEIVDMYIELANKERNIADATVYSIRQLTEEEKYAIAETFAKICGKAAIRIHNVIDDNLLGGIKVRIDNRIYDGSLQGKITQIRRELIKKSAGASLEK